MSTVYLPTSSHLEDYFKDFPTTFTFSDYEDNLVFVEESERREHFTIIAQKVAALYAISMQSPIKTMELQSRSNVVKFKEEKIKEFRDKLTNYIFERLLKEQEVILITNIVPQSTLKEVLNECKIYLEPKARDNIFFFPYKSIVTIAPYVLEKGHFHKGLRVFMQRL